MADPYGLDKYKGTIPQAQLDAMAAIFAAKPDQYEVFTSRFGGDPKKFIASFTDWWTKYGGQVADKMGEFQPEEKLLNALGYSVNPNYNSGSTPLEQALLEKTLPQITGDISKDSERQTVADQLANSAISGANTANNILSRSTGGHFDAHTYFNSYPAVRGQWVRLPNGKTPGTKVVDGKEVTADQWAEQYYLTTGQQQGQKPAYVQSAQLAQDFANADTTTAANIAAANQSLKTQTDALASATTELQSNLQGDLKAKADALAQQIATLNSNLDTLNDAQKAALTQQIATQQADLEQSIATQRQALETQISALGNAADAQAVAQRSALQTEIQSLTAAQAPLAAARTQAAQLQATAVNVGLQRTNDQLAADAAKAGYVGTSTAQQGALARAGIDARQQAAQALGSANVANASDTRDIGVQGATGEKSIADQLAQAQAGIAAQKANTTAGLTNTLAQGMQQLGDTQATGLAGIANNTATTRAAIGAQGANQTYADTTAGADKNQSILDALAQGKYNLTSTNAQQVQNAQETGNAAKATYYDSDYNRSLTAALAPTQIASTLAGSLTGLDNYANSGLQRGLGELNWWSTGAGTAPTLGATATQADTTGNTIANAGAGLLNIGANAGIKWLMNNSKPTTPTPTPTKG